ncbi:MAG: PhzF family phenazine biosynthesis protein [Gammaproteobacteria bacterium]|nr:PhzF family phenazine biosynthesis protein [Gammaproteobacteria bacterium]
MPEYRLAVYNAFSESTFGGSAAAIIADAGNLDDDQMQRISKELGAPATCFITSIEDRNIKVRFFSTLTEYSMCGHGTIALMTWLVDSGSIAIDKNRNGKLAISLHTPGSSAAVEIHCREDARPRVMLSLAAANFEDCSIGAGELAPLLGVDEQAFNADLPVKLTRSDFTHLIVPIRNLVSIQHVRPDFIALTAFCRKMQVDTVALFTTETLMPESSIHCRDFCPAVGTPEASATGTTNRALACYLVQQGLLDAKTGTRHTVIAEQGYEMGRPSQIRIEMTIQDGQPVGIMVGGVATKSIEGIFYLT